MTNTQGFVTLICFYMFESLHEGLSQLNSFKQGGTLQSDACFWETTLALRFWEVSGSSTGFPPELPHKSKQDGKTDRQPSDNNANKPLRVLKVQGSGGQPVIKTHVALHCMGGGRIQTWGILMAVVRRTRSIRPHGEVWQSDRVCSQTRSRSCRLRFTGISRLPLPQVPGGPPDSPD